jgi:aspartate carbamoyltransferase catalytic subunit
MDKLFHVVEAQQFDRDLLSEIFAVTKEMEEVVSRYGSSILSRRIMASLFYEPSTRTRLSFESAMFRLGGNVITTESAREFSSAAKGETLEDTIRIIQGYSDVIVMRHYESGAARRAANVASVPIINAGDGPGQHPTQALLDLYTIKKDIGRLDGLKIAMVGDLANGRTVRSLTYLMSKYDDIRFYFVAPSVVKMKDDIKAHLDEHGVQWEEVEDLIAVSREVDVVYQTRIQRERFGDRTEDYEKARGKYIIDDKVMAVLPEKSIVMHPLPRIDEIAVEVDSDPRAAYFRQAHNGLYIRMALLRMVLDQ